VRAGELRNRIAITVIALTLALTFGVMGATGFALAVEDTTSSVPPPSAQATPAVGPTLTVPVPVSAAAPAAPDLF